jgi:acyl-CoA reductase-like NAD-dependent aldehyde dehydrogenase
VKGRVAAAEFADRSGPTLRASDQLAISEVELGDGIHPTIDEAVRSARRAFEGYRDMGLEARKTIVEAMRAAMLKEGERLAYMAAEETGIGRAEDKVVKNRLVTTKTPGPEDLEPHVVTGDAGMVVTEYAPYGVIGSITPTTNPTSTIINNSIAMVSAGNAVVFNVHPNASLVSVENVKLLNRAIVAAGGPADLITATPQPTLESARELMHHPDIRVLPPVRAIRPRSWIERLTWTPRDVTSFVVPRSTTTSSAPMRRRPSWWTLLPIDWFSRWLPTGPTGSKSTN